MKFGKYLFFCKEIVSSIRNYFLPFKITLKRLLIFLKNIILLFIDHNY